MLRGKTKSLLVTSVIVCAFILGVYAENITSYFHRDPRVKMNVYVFHEHVNGVDQLASGNLMTDIGENYIRNVMGFNNVTNFNQTQWISVSNDATPLVTWTKLPGEVTANGFNRAVADSADAWVNSGDYAVNFTKKFTATGTQQLQCAGSNWNDTEDSDNNLYAAAAFTQTTFEDGDNCTIRFVFTYNAN